MIYDTLISQIDEFYSKKDTKQAKDIVKDIVEQADIKQLTDFVYKLYCERTNSMSACVILRDMYKDSVTRERFNALEKVNEKLTIRVNKIQGELKRRGLR